MCLYNITKEFKRPTRKVRMGYKILERDYPYGKKAGLIAPYQETIFTKGKEATAIPHLIDAYIREEHVCYKAGFHVLKSLKDVYKYAPSTVEKIVHNIHHKGEEIWEVTYHQTRLEGLDGGNAHVAMADKMTPVRKVTKKELRAFLRTV